MSGAKDDVKIEALKLDCRELINQVKSDSIKGCNPNTPVNEFSQHGDSASPTSVNSVPIAPTLSPADSKPNE